VGDGVAGRWGGREEEEEELFITANG